MTEGATLEWLGHATVRVTTASGVRVLFDPYEPMGFDGRIAHRPIRSEVDIVAITHHHRDHCHVTPAMGAPTIVERSCRVGDLRFRTVPAYHDQERGRRMGLVRMIALEADGVCIVHLGDLGVPPMRRQVQRLGRPDVLLLPVGGTYTIDDQAGAETVRRFAPRVVVPFHFRNEQVMLPMIGVGPFLTEARKRGWEVVEREGSTLRLPLAPTPGQVQVQVLRPSH